MSEARESRFPIFEIALIVAGIILIVILNQIPFPDHYSFFNYLVVFLVSGFFGALAFMIVNGLMSEIYRFIVNILAVFYILLNAVYISLCIAYFELLKLRLASTFNFDPYENSFLVFLILAVILILWNIGVAIFFVPIAKLFDEELLS